MHSVPKSVDAIASCSDSPRSDGPAREPEGALCLLLADDDPQVRAFTSRVLTWAGWRVTSVANGREAVDAWPVGGDPFDLVVLDIVMPEMNGFEAYRELSRRHPEAKFLFISAYAHELNLDTFLEEGRTFFVAKPFVPHFLVSKVRAVVDASRPDPAPVLLHEGARQA